MNTTLIGKRIITSTWQGSDLDESVYDGDDDYQQLLETAIDREARRGVIRESYTMSDGAKAIHGYVTDFEDPATGQRRYAAFYGDDSGAEYIDFPTKAEAVAEYEQNVRGLQSTAVENQNSDAEPWFEVCDLTPVTQQRRIIYSDWTVSDLDAGIYTGEGDYRELITEAIDRAGAGGTLRESCTTDEAGRYACRAFVAAFIDPAAYETRYGYFVLDAENGKFYVDFADLDEAVAEYEADARGMQEDCSETDEDGTTSAWYETTDLD